MHSAFASAIVRSGNGAVLASMLPTNLASLARSAALVSVSTPPLPRLRCCTLASTSSSDDAAPLWKYGAPANTLSSDGMLMPSTPLAPSVLS